MNFGVIYELRDRLESAAVAGVGLLGEDFRLKRAVEQIAPLAKASPVFGRIYEMGCRLMESSQEERGCLLLDVLALVDAVLCTQGSLLKDGQWEPVEDLAGAGTVCTNIPYSKLAPVLDAFEGTGGGRYALLRNAHKEDGQLFSDYRIRNLMVKALGDSYGELADMVMGWLKMEGSQVIPLLKQGFDPEGGQDMARRVRIVEEIAGAEENGFYLEILKTAGKPVREAAIKALRHDMGNEKALLDLVKSEKGNAKEAAYFSLACMEGEAACGYWKKMLDKNLEKGVTHLVNAPAPWASDLIADQIERWLDAYDLSKTPWKNLKNEDKGQLLLLMKGAERKHSPKLCALYRRLYEVAPQEAAKVLNASLKWECHPNLRRTAQELYDAFGDVFLDSVFWADLLDDEPKQLFERFCGYVTMEEDEGAGKKPPKKRDPAGILQVLSHVRYEERLGKYVVYREPFCQMAGQQEPVKTLEHGLDLRWYECLLNNKNRFDMKWKKPYYYYGGRQNGYDVMLEGLLRPDVEAVKEAYGKYYYWNARYRGTEAGDIRILKRCGWSDYRGLLTHVGKRDQSQMVYKVRQVLEELPLSNEEMAKELEELVQGLGKKAITGIGILERWVDELKSGIPVDELKQAYR